MSDTSQKYIQANNPQTLDDFDFTVLAATSVLGDLMEKCPPAESCRDAFERMSKATVQMCMSTPGFGFSRDRDDHHHTNAHLSSNAMSMMTDLDVKQDYRFPQQTHVRARRPPPKFDMNLRDLFPDDLDSRSRASQSFPQQLPDMQRMHTSMNMQMSPQQQQQQQPKPNFQQMQQPQSQPQQRSPASSINSHINAGSMGIDTTYMYDPQQQQQQQQQSSAPFYNNNNTSSDHTQNQDAAGLLPAMDFLDAAGVATNDDFSFDTSALDLGFGMGMGLDFQHDWSDGQQIDLFDGFFFGNNGAGTGGL